MNEIHDFDPDDIPPFTRGEKAALLVLLVLLLCGNWLVETVLNLLVHPA